MISANLRRGGRHAIDIGDNVPNSLMLDSTASQALSRVFGAPTDGKKWTLSLWLKRGKLGLYETLFCADGTHDNTNFGQLLYNLTDSIDLQGWTSSYRQPPDKYRDPAGFTHLHFAYDSTLGTDIERFKMWAGGRSVTVTPTVLSIILNQVTPFNVSGVTHWIGGRAGADFFDGYLSNIHFIDGQALDPSYFGRTSADTGAWVNKTYAGTYGINGFKLEFLNGASLGTDTSGNGNHWTLNGGIVAANQYMDTPTNNFPVANPLSMLKSVGLPHKGNTVFNLPSAATLTQVSTFAVQSGAYYVEAKVTYVSNPAFETSVGFAPFAGTSSITKNLLYLSSTGQVFIDGLVVATFAAYALNDTVSFAADFTNNIVYIRKNNVLQGSVNIYFDSSWTFLAFQHGINHSSEYEVNFGARPFTYTPPTGFKALCTANLPQTSIIKPARYFKAKTRTGTGAAYNVSGIEFSPDLVWIKSSSAISSHDFFDTVRGVRKHISSDLTTPEYTELAGASLTAFNGDGFSLGTENIGDGRVNTAAAVYVDWMWEKGIVAGLDIVTYVGNGANRTISHGLGVAPKMVIIKDLSSATNYAIWHASFAAPTTGFLNFSSGVVGSGETLWNSTVPTSSVFSLGTDASVNTNLDNFIAYLFAEVEGFSKFGTYAGNNVADGTFVHCGFRPAYVMIKRTDTAGDWVILDNARDLYNVDNHRVYANSSVAQDTADSPLDATSNGFKLRSNAGVTNGAGTYIFMAFAEMPFKYSNAR